MGNFKGLIDHHLNIFWQYDGKPYLENNITKAIINTLDGLSEAQVRKVLVSLLGITIKEGKMKIDFYLQKKPTISKIEEFDEANRIMFAFSPTGKCWGFDGLDIKDEKALFKAIKEDLRKDDLSEEELNRETKKAVDEYLKDTRGDSIPDGWIFIYVDGKPEYVIALENKLYNLDPTQINNHIEKSLLITTNKKPVIYRKYSEIIQSLEKVETFITDQFVEYMIILGYYTIMDFSVVCIADKDIRQKLAIPFGERILSKITVNGEDIDKRKWNIVRRHVSYDYLGEINLIFEKDYMKLSLAFGSTQSSGKTMLKRIDVFSVPQDHLLANRQSFHLIYQRGKIISNSYIDYYDSIENYISYLRKNIELIKTSTPQEAIELYRKLLLDNFITKENYDALSEQLKNKTNPVVVVPEIIFEYGWTYEEASKLGIDSLASELNKKIHEILTLMKL